MTTAERVFRAVEKVVPMTDEERKTDTTFRSLCVDSLALIDINIHLEEEFGRPMPVDRRPGTIQEVVDFYSGK